MKKIFIALGIIASVGLVGSVSINHSYAEVRAEETTSETISEETSIDESSEEIPSEETTKETEKESFYDKLSQGAKDFLIVAKDILNQPIVIGGVSVTLGAIVVWVIGKLFSVLGKKRVNALANQVNDLIAQMKESVEKKDFNALSTQTQELVEVCKVLADGTRNVKVKEQALSLLKQFDPVIQDNKQFAIDETEKVIEDGKKQFNKTAKEIVDIANKD